MILKGSECKLIHLLGHFNTKDGRSGLRTFPGLAFLPFGRPFGRFFLGVKLLLPRGLLAAELPPPLVLLRIIDPANR